jgi:hypothetical protein
MAAGVVLDTSFLITLADAGRNHHSAARQYWRHFTENGMPIFLPTIVVSEFCVRQTIPPKILRCCVLVPFNWDDALQTAQLEFSKDRNPEDDRHALKDDVKILAQAMVKDAAFAITDDTRTFYRYARRLHEAGRAAFQTIKLEDGFDPAFFNGGQRELGLDQVDTREREEP